MNWGGVLDICSPFRDRPLQGRNKNMQGREQEAAGLAGTREAGGSLGSDPGWSLQTDPVDRLVQDAGLAKPPSGQPTKVLLADDHRLMRSGLRHILAFASD
eukprot:gene13794-18604_t